MKPIIKTAANFTEELNQPTDNKDRKRKIFNTEKKIRRLFEDEMGKQNTACQLY
jgi:hypothetical protein